MEEVSLLQSLWKQSIFLLEYNFPRERPQTHSRRNKNLSNTLQRWIPSEGNCIQKTTVLGGQQEKNGILINKGITLYRTLFY